MSSIVPPGTVAQDQDTILASLDWAPVCGMQNQWGCTHGADLAVWGRPKPCGCSARRDFMYLHHACWARLTSPGQTVYCPQCLAVYRFIDTVLRVEAI